MAAHHERSTFELIGLAAASALFGGIAAHVATLGLEALFSDDLAEISAYSALVFLAFSVTFASLWVVAGGLAWLAGFTFERPFRVTLASIILAFAASSASYLVGVEAASGAWASKQSWAWMLPWAFAVAGGGATAIGFALTVSKPMSFGVTALLFPAALICFVIDASLFTGLYPTLHIALRMAGTGLFVAWAWRASAFHHMLPRPKIVGAVSLPLLIGGLALSLMLPATVRSDLLLRGGAAGYIVGMVRVEASGDRLTRLLQAPPRPPSERLVDAENDGAEVENVVLIMVDTLRADVLPPLRPTDGKPFAKPTDTPFLDGLLEECTTFERAYAQSSATHRSMPPAFRSTYSWEPSAGFALGHSLTARGVTTGAAVNNYFFEPFYKSSQDLLLGFDAVELYDSHWQDQLAPTASRVFDRIEDEKFFAWVHVFAVHNPGYDGELLGKGVGHHERYRRSLKWMDAQLAKIHQDLEERGLLDETAIVFASDHGEGLGANNIWTHGPTVFEEEIRVPLAICMPERKGKLITAPVSNIDLAPTIFDLMGLEPEPSHRGYSLAPVIARERRAFEPLYFENWSGDKVGMYLDDHKFVYSPENEILLKFDLLKDPLENDNLFDPDEDFEFERSLFEMVPRLVTEEVDKGENPLFLRKRIRAIDPEKPGKDFLFLMRLAAASQSEAVHEDVRKLFENLESLRARYEVMRAFRKDDLAAELFTWTLENEAHDEVDILMAASRADFDVATFKGLRSKIDALTFDDDRLAAEWLTLANTHRKSTPAWKKTITEMLEKVLENRRDTSRYTRFIALANVVSTRWSGTPSDVATMVREFYDDPGANVRRMAAMASLILNDRAAMPALSKLALDPDEDIMVKQQAVESLGKLARDGDEKTAQIIYDAALPNSYLTIYANAAFADMVLPDWIDKLTEHHPRRKSRAQASKKRALRAQKLMKKREKK